MPHYPRERYRGKAPVDENTAREISVRSRRKRGCGGDRGATARGGKEKMDKLIRERMNKRQTKELKQEAAVIPDPIEDGSLGCHQGKESALYKNHRAVGTAISKHAHRKGGDGKEHNAEGKVQKDAMEPVRIRDGKIRRANDHVFSDGRLRLTDDQLVDSNHKFGRDDKTQKERKPSKRVTQERKSKKAGTDRVVHSPSPISAGNSPKKHGVDELLDSPGPSQSPICRTTRSPTAPSSPKNPANKIAKHPKNEVEKWAIRALEKGVEGLQEEFLTSLRRYTKSGMTKKAFKNKSNDNRNRYRDVPCQDQYRVLLNWPGQENDYIHANYLTTPLNLKRFICTQGPLNETTVDFWHMVIQEECSNIVMLCNVKEDNMAKCAQYWPAEPDQIKRCGDVEITNITVRQSIKDDTSVKISYLRIKFTLDGQERCRDVRHLHWINWPDKGVPPFSPTALTLLANVRGTTKPIVVHCSAGIGRTGTIVTIECVLERLQDGQSCEHMDDLLKQIRSQRAYAIQTDLQYLYLHRTLLYYFFDKSHFLHGSTEMAVQYKKFIEEYDKAVAHSSDH